MDKLTASNTSAPRCLSRLRSCRRRVRANERQARHVSQRRGRLERVRPSLRACKLKQATLMEGVMRSLRLSAMSALGQKQT
jgi:hypothetical protein